MRWRGMGAALEGEARGVSSPGMPLSIAPRHDETVWRCCWYGGERSGRLPFRRVGRWPLVTRSCLEVTPVFHLNTGVFFCEDTFL